MILLQSHLNSAQLSVRFSLPHWSDREPYLDTLAWIDTHEEEEVVRATVPVPEEEDNSCQPSPDASSKDNTWEMPTEKDCMEAAAARLRVPQWRQAAVSRDGWKCSCCSASFDC